MDEVKRQRQWMKSNFAEWYQTDTDQKKQLPQPPLFKSFDEKAKITDLPAENENSISETGIIAMLQERQSHRDYLGESLTLAELSFLLWATQGVKGIRGNNYATLRTVPSGGARHPFETYLVISRVGGLKPGVYQYLAQSHQLLFFFAEESIEQRLTALTLGQRFVGKSAVTFIWSCLPYRGEWRYHKSAHKVMLLDAGHVCENLYLACTAVGCGTCAIGSYDQVAIDQYLGLDGEDEFVVYMAPVGKVDIVGENG